MSESIQDVLAKLPSEYTKKPVRIGVIGGTGLSKLEGFTPVAAIRTTTPWGAPSSPIQILEHGDLAVAFLSRHGLHHQLAPHEVPNRANVAALRRVGVRCIVAFTAVGSLREDIKPMDFVLPDQAIDRTKGVRAFTFFEGGLVGHVGFADPFDARVAAIIKSCVDAMSGDGVVLHDKGTVVVMEGPQFSTRAESHMYRSWGGSVINMSTLPEAKLAREAEIAYQPICMATDYDCWHSAGDDVDVAMVLGYMAANGANARRLVAAVLDRLADAQHADLVRAKHLEGASVGAVKFMTKPEGRSKKALEDVDFLFPGIAAVLNS